MNKKKISLIVVGVLLLIGIVITGAYVTISASIDDNTICKGVFIGSVDVGGMTTEQATEAVDRYIADRASKKVTIQVEEDTVSSTVSELGYQVTANDAVEQAMNIGKTGNIIKRYKEIKDVEKDNKVYDLEVSLDNTAVQYLVEEECTKYDIPAQNASMKRQNGQFVVSEHVIGRKIDVDATIKAITDAIMNDWDGQDIELTATVEEDIPAVAAMSQENDETIVEFKDSVNIVKMPKKGGTGLNDSLRHICQLAHKKVNKENIEDLVKTICY